MVGAVIPATKAEQERNDIIATYCGCLPCLLKKIPNVHATIQHVSEGRVRLGQSITYGSCIWHHLGKPLNPDKSADQHRKERGPSLYEGKRPFEAEFGDELHLVAVQNYMVNLWRTHRWEPYAVPFHVVSDVQVFWGKLLADQQEI